VGLGGAAAGLGAPAWLAGAVGAVSALVAGVIVDRAFGTRDADKAALEARAKVLDELTAPVPADPEKAVAANRADPLALLRADRSPMPFRGRGRELRRLTEWLADDAVASPVFLLSGPAGVGKSRLALQFASRVPDGWVAGWLHVGTGPSAVDDLAACKDPVLILVDDADGRPDLGAFLDGLGAHNGKPVIRVIVITRSAEGLRASLVSRLAERHATTASGAAALELEPEGGQDDRARWFAEAVDAFAAALRRPAPPLTEVSDRSDITPFVMIQARALLAVLGGADDPRRLSFGEVAEALMRHEKRRWEALAKTRDWGSGGPPSGRLRERAVAALALLGAGSEAEAEEILVRVPEFRDATAERRYDIAAWISTLYPAPPGTVPRIRPDMIGEWFVVSQLAGNPALAEGLRVGLTDEQAARALGFLARAADWIEEAGPLFGEFAAGDVRRQVRAAALAALTGEAGRHLLDAVVAGQLASAEGWTLEELDELDRLIPENVLLRTHAVIDAHSVSLHRQLAAADPAGHSAALGTALTVLAWCLQRLGRYREALADAQEAVTLYRNLPAGVPADLPVPREAGLARALNTLGVCFDKLGHHAEAVEATGEAVTLYRDLPATLPPPYHAGLAMTLNNLGIQLGHLGRSLEAFDAAREAVTVYRALADGDRDAYQAGLATALNNLGVRLGHISRSLEALDAAQEAVALYRALPADSPAADRGGFAVALDSLGIRLLRLGRYPEALDATQEAITAYRALSHANPAAYRALLAEALTSLGIMLDRVGRYQEALEAAREAVTLSRVLAADVPAAHRADLARALDNLGVYLDRVGRHQEALDATQEAVTAYRALAEGETGAHEADLALALRNLGAVLNQLGRHQEALAAAQEAIALRRALADSDPAAHNADLAATLGLLGAVLDELDRHQEALHARKEAVRVYRQLAGRDPELYQAEYHQALGALQREYDQRGMPVEAIVRDLLDHPTAGEAGAGEEAGIVRDE